MLNKIIKLFVVFIVLLLPCFGIEEDKKPECGCEHHSHSAKNIEVKENSKLDIKDCITIGIQNSPVIKEYAHKLEIAKSNVGIAKSAYFPEISIGAGFRQELNSNRDEYIRNYRELPSVGMALNQLIWDFGKTSSNIRMEKFLEIASEYEFNDIICLSVFQIKMKYYNVLRSLAYLNAVKTENKIEEEIIYQIKKMGKNKADYMDAKTKIGETRSNLVTAELNYKNSIEELNGAIYLEDAPKYSIYQTQSFYYNPVEQNIFKGTIFKIDEEIKKDETIFEHPNFSPKEAVEIAYKNSPDLKALQATRDAFFESYNLAKRNYYPTLDLGTGYNYIHSNHFNNNNFGVGVNLDASLNGMYQKYNTKGAKAQLDLADTEIITFKKDLYFTVRKCLNSVKLSLEKVKLAKEQMNDAKEFFELTYKRYVNDEASINDFQGSVTSYTNSLKNHIDTQYEYNIALIKLEMAMHEHLIDYHDDAHHAAEFHEGEENSALSKMINCGKKHKN